MESLLWSIVEEVKNVDLKTVQSPSGEADEGAEILGTLSADAIQLFEVRRRQLKQLETLEAGLERQLASLHSAGSAQAAVEEFNSKVTEVRILRDKTTVVSNMLSAQIRSEFPSRDINDMQFLIVKGWRVVALLPDDDFGPLPVFVLRMRGPGEPPA